MVDGTCGASERQQLFRLLLSFYRLWWNLWKSFEWIMKSNWEEIILIQEGFIKVVLGWKGFSLASEGWIEGEFWILFSLPFWHLLLKYFTIIIKRRRCSILLYKMWVIVGCRCLAIKQIVLVGSYVVQYFGSWGSGPLPFSIQFHCHWQSSVASMLFSRHLTIGMNSSKYQRGTKLWINSNAFSKPV